MKSVAKFFALFLFGGICIFLAVRLGIFGFEEAVHSTETHVYYHASYHTINILCVFVVALIAFFAGCIALAEAFDEPRTTDEPEPDEEDEEQEEPDFEIEVTGTHTARNGLEFTLNARGNYPNLDINPEDLMTLLLIEQALSRGRFV